MPTTLPNMNLSVPVSGETNYPTSVSNSLTNVDNHDHTTGKGLQIPTGGIADSAVTTVKIADLNVTTGKIAANAVTRAKLASVGQQQSGSINFSTASTTYVDVTGATLSITTTGRPVMTMVIPDGSVISYLNIRMTATAPFVGRQYGGFIKLVRDATDVQSHGLLDIAEQTAELVGINRPANLFYFDAPGAGTYTYKLQALVNGANESIEFFNCRLVAYEL